MENLKSNPYSYLTAKERDGLSFPARFLLKNRLLTGNVLDFGCGFGKDVELLSAEGVAITGYDKHYFPEYPQGRFDTILCFYVLNVLLPEEQAAVLIELSQLLKPGGRAYLSVRRDIHYEGFRLHQLYHKPTYQCRVRLAYPSLLVNENCEIYEYRHYNQYEHPHKSNCPFCAPDRDSELVMESATVYAIYDKFPVSRGHVLIIPKRHCPDYFQLTFKEQSACWFMLNKVKEMILQQYHPDGFNIGVNVNPVAGQTIDHVHIHLIPRYHGDVEDPVGGVRGVIPARRKY